jgi:hypothetical protein
MSGRHGAPERAGVSTRPSPAASSRLVGRRRSRAATRRAVAVVAAVALALPVAAAGGLALAGVPLLPGDAEAAPAPATAADPAPAVVRTVTPAAAALTDVLATGPGTGWTASGPVTWAPATPFDHACDLERTAASVAGERTYLNSTGTAVTVSVRAFGAGIGALAYSSLRERVLACPGNDAEVSAYDTVTDGRDTVAATVRPEGSPSSVGTLTWRRGDVVVTVLGAGRSPSSLERVAARLDTALTARLVAVCPDLTGRVADAVRNPWYDRIAYVGWLVAQGVTVPPIGDPVPPAGITPVPAGAVLPTVPTVTLPTRPADPVWPTELPSPVPAPVAPASPGPEPTATTVEVPTPDPRGPGCGWAFTGFPAPVLDEAALIATREATLQSARDGLAAGQQAWSQQVLAYWAAAAQYDCKAAKASPPTPSRRISSRSRGARSSPRAARTTPRCAPGTTRWPPTRGGSASARPRWSPTTPPWPRARPAARSRPRRSRPRPPAPSLPAPPRPPPRRRRRPCRPAAPRRGPRSWTSPRPACPRAPHPPRTPAPRPCPGPPPGNRPRAEDVGPGDTGPGRATMRGPCRALPRAP